MGTIYTVCVYLDPEGPQSLSSATPQGAYQLASFQWFEMNQLEGPGRDPSKEKWKSTNSDPKLYKSKEDKLAFYFVWTSSSTDSLGERAQFNIHWKNRKGEQESPLVDDDGTAMNKLSDQNCFSKSIKPPGLSDPTDTWLFGPYPIKAPSAGQDPDSDELRRFTFTIAARGEGRGFFLDPEMETRP